ncbi:MAG: ribonuclease H-like domain-containing protein [Thermoplasmata archaeon]
MLRSTFLHLTDIGERTELQLWSNQITSWEKLRAWSNDSHFSPARRARLRSELDQSENALRSFEGAWFARRLPTREHWRLYRSFSARTAFLDIETTSLSPYQGVVTVVCVHGGGQTRTFVADDDLEELPAHLKKFEVLVTFNGRMFDVPFLEVRFPQLEVPPAHIDLRFVLHRIGISGGLKRIEQTLGLGDRSGVEGIHGADAVRLWEEFRRGNTAALERLVRYNRADTVNLEPLMDFAFTELSRRLLPVG